MRDLMIDLETLGLYPGCVIISIGAVFFDMECETVTNLTFYRNITSASCLLHGMTVDQKTVDWWDKQSVEAKHALTDPKPVDLDDALRDFQAWVVSHTVLADLRVWSHGLSFDIPLLRDAEHRTGCVLPWNFRNERDTRTMFMVARYFNETAIMQKIERLQYGRGHHALDDAIRQAMQICQLWSVTR